MTYEYTSSSSPNPLECGYVTVGIVSAPTFTAKYGAKVKALHGSYTECRGGYVAGRDVRLPLTNEGRELLATILAAYEPGHFYNQSKAEREARVYLFKFDFHPDICVYQRCPLDGQRKGVDFSSQVKARDLDGACREYELAYERAVEAHKALPIAEIRAALAAHKAAQVSLADNIAALDTCLPLNGFISAPRTPGHASAASFTIYLANGYIAQVGALATGYHIVGASVTRGGWDKPRHFNLQQTLRILAQLGTINLD